MVSKYVVISLPKLIDHYKVVVYTTEGISEVRADMLSICSHRRGLMSNTFTSTITSLNIVKMCVLKGALGFAKIG